MELIDLKSELTDLTDDVIQELRGKVQDASIRDLVSILSTSSKVIKDIDERIQKAKEIESAEDSSGTFGSTRKLSPAAQRLMGSNLRP